MAKSVPVPARVVRKLAEEEEEEEEKEKEKEEEAKHTTPLLLSTS